MRIEQGAWVIVADGGRAKIFENRGGVFEPSLRLVAERHHDNPPDREQSSDKPGRYPSHGGQRESVENTDRHRMAKQAFAQTVAAWLEKLLKAHDPPSIVLAAPATALGDLRAALPDPVRARIAEEIARDFTNHPEAEIARLMAST